MPFIPLPFVVSILLLVLFGLVVWRDDDGAQANKPFLALILVSVFQSFLSGLHWGYGVQEVMYLAPVGAATVPPLAYAGVAKLVHENDQSLMRRLGLHAVPAVVVVVLLATWRSAIDMALVLIFVGYAVAILLLMRPGADALRLAPFDGAAPAYRAILLAAFALFFSAIIEAFVSFDMAWTHGAHTKPVIAVGNLAVLIILSVAAASASRSHTPVEAAAAAPEAYISEDRETIAAVTALMQTKHVYRDVDLNLDRLARKLGIPARQVSAAINRATGKNVSQYVNEHRIAEACGLLAQTDRPVTEIMFEVGFQTKSNFNREFRRVTETTPLEWRERNAKASSIAI